MPPTDPFFFLPGNSDWNACIGKQGDEENYADGYIEAAIELAAAILGKKMYEKRDTLVFPILYNARHAIELSLKMIIGELVKAGILKSSHPKNHNIFSHLKFLEVQAVPDELFGKRLSALWPFVHSLAQIDDDGQELRFHENRDGQRSMEGKALANIEIIGASLLELQEVLKNLKYRAFSLCDEWRTGTRTSLCSRLDLIEIAKLLPARRNWKTESFSECKQAVKERYGLGNRQFSLALNKIQETRELACMIGVESDPIHLSDEKAILLLNHWSDLHPPRDPKDVRDFDYFSERNWDEIKMRREVQAKVIADVVGDISEEEFADAEVIYYLARDRNFSESYEDRVEGKKKEFKARGDFRQDVNDLMSKTNFRHFFVEGLRRVGRVSLSIQLSEGRIN
jgi:hypothetical protein